MPDPGRERVGGELHDGLCQPMADAGERSPRPPPAAPKRKNPGTFWTMPPSMGRLAGNQARIVNTMVKRSSAALQAAVEVHRRSMWWGSGTRRGGGPLVNRRGRYGSSDRFGNEARSQAHCWGTGHPRRTAAKRGGTDRR